MNVRLTDAARFDIHRKLVLAALRDVLGLEQIRDRPVVALVDHYYDRLPVRVRMTVVHDDPLWLAFQLVPRVVHIAGYNLFSFTRASAVVKCQSALTCFLFRLSSQAATSSTRVSLSGTRRSRH